MCSPLALNEITEKITRAAKDTLGVKLDKVILYGSYARGDYDIESDIDIMVLADIPHESCWSEYIKISELIWMLDLEYNVLVSVSVTDSATFNKYADILPFYQNVQEEGVVLVA